MIKHFEIIDTHTGKVVATRNTRSGATRTKDNLDEKYGAVRYVSRPVYAD